MRTFIRKNPALAQLSIVAVGLVLLCGLLWNLQAEPQRRRIPPGPKGGVNYAKFNHASHSKNCASCHKVEEGERVTRFPGHNSCNDCHFFPAFTVGARAYCIVCHTPPGNNARVKRFPDQRQDQFSIKFPHNVHVGMDVKDYNPIVAVKEMSEEKKKVQAVAEKGGCISCHVKDGPEKKETSFSKPYHSECAQCHGTEGKKVAPAMNNCAGCHQTPARRTELSGLVDNFRHDKDHERDIRPTAKSKAMLDCKFCHTTAVRAKALVDIQPPEADKCLACHNDEIARALKPQELAKLKKAEPGVKKDANDKTPVLTKPASEKTPIKPAEKPEAKPEEKPAAKPAEKPANKAEPPAQRR